MTVNQEERACKAWDILVECAQKNQTITYKNLGNAIGIHHRPVRFVLELIQRYCLEEKLPPLTILVVNQSGQPGTGFIAWDIDNYNEGFDKVIKKNWSLKENPFSWARNGEQYKKFISSLANNPEESEEIYAKVKTRGIAQKMFRDALLEAYNKKCAFTQISFAPGLQAAHIIPWSKSSKSERMDIRNGVLLNSFHHSLFDKGMMTITNDYRIAFYDPEMEQQRYSKYDKILTINLHLQKMTLPKNKEQQPLLKYISKHHKIYEWDFA